MGRFLYVMLPPLIFSIFICSYFFRLYKVQNPEITVQDNQKNSGVVMDPLSVRDVFPNFFGNNVKFLLCLNNKNKINLDGKPFDMGKLPDGFDDIKKEFGAMAVHVSSIDGFEIYQKIGGSECKPIDVEKLSSSKVISDINTSFVAATVTEKDVKDLQDGKQIIVSNKVSIDLNNTILYVRMQWSNLIFITLASFLGWFGVVLLLNKVAAFIKGDNKF